MTRIHAPLRIQISQAEYRPLSCAFSRPVRRHQDLAFRFYSRRLRFYAESESQGPTESESEQQPPEASEEPPQEVDPKGPRYIDELEAPERTPLSENMQKRLREEYLGLGGAENTPMTTNWFLVIILVISVLAVASWLTGAI